MGNCVQLTSDGNYIISGSKNNDDSLWLLKVDTAGKIHWSKTYGRSEGLVTRWLEKTKDGGYIIAPRTPSLLKVNAQGDSLWSHDYGIYSYCVQPTSDNGFIVIGGTNGFGYDEQLILIKTNPNGDTVWTKTYAEPGNNRNSAFFIQVTADSGFIITGKTGYTDPEYNFWVDLWLLKTDRNGDIKWSKKLWWTGVGRDL